MGSTSRVVISGNVEAVSSFNQHYTRIAGNSTKSQQDSRDSHPQALWNPDPFMFVSKEIVFCECHATKCQSSKTIVGRLETGDL